MLNTKNRLPFLRNPLGCACFCCAAVFGALVGRAVFASVYDAEARALLAGLNGMGKPDYRSAPLIICALLPALLYCAAIYVSGLRRALLPLWAAAVLCQGVGFGMQLGMAKALLVCGYAGAAWLTVLLPMLVLLPLYAYIALLALARVGSDAPAKPVDGMESLTAAVVASALLAALVTLFTTLGCLYCLGRLFD